MDKLLPGTTAFPVGKIPITFEWWMVSHCILRFGSSIRATSFSVLCVTGHSVIALRLQRTHVTKNCWRLVWDGWVYIKTSPVKVHNFSVSLCGPEFRQSLSQKVTEKLKVGQEREMTRSCLPSRRLQILDHRSKNSIAIAIPEFETQN